MAAGIRILVDVLVYRLRRLEMANLVAAAAIMIALRTTVPDFIVRGVFAVLLNVLAYATNDYCDIDRDLAGGRDPVGRRYLKDHMREALGAQIALAVVLAAIAVWWAPGLLVAGTLGAGICWVYSMHLKTRPYVDILAMTAWGIAMPMVAIRLDDPLGWALLIQLGLYSSVFETIQVLRDREEDTAAGIRTTAVALGERRTLALARVLMVIASAYGVLLLHWGLGLIPLIAVALPWRRLNTSAYWTRVRVVLGVGWLAVLAWVFVTGRTDGLL
jgi:4-hydroxybenzoate polyprenyltransferase